MRRRPLGMVGRIALVLLCAVVLEFLGNVALQRWQERELIGNEQVERIAARLVAAEGKALFARAWGVLRNLSQGKAASPPRIWAT